MIPDVIENTRVMVRSAELALTLPHVQVRSPLATNARACLIRQVWWGDRVVALARDGENYSEAFGNLEINVRAARRAMLLLRKAIKQDLDRR
jgi:hypothetical protein